MAEPPLERAKARALRLLERRDYSEAELAAKLAEKGEEPETAQAAARRMVELGFVNDESYAGAVVRHYAAKGFGRQRIREELRRRRVPRELWDAALEELDGQDETAERLLAALDTLETALRELNFSHNNLRAGNLRWSGGRFVPLRYHDAHFGPSGDGAAFESLREQVRRTADPMCVGDTEAVYTPHRRLTGHRWTSHVFEGLVCVEDDEGFGFVDTENNPVIRPQYTWAGDFREGRAEVETPSGMGLIDRQGRYVIPPEYEIVDYAPAESIVRVRKDGRWAEFDYLGRRLTEFGTNND
jgi:hypothetical protein